MAERTGSGTPGRRGSGCNRDAQPALPAAGWMGHERPAISDRDADAAPSRHALKSAIVVVMCEQAQAPPPTACSGMAHRHAQPCRADGVRVQS